MKPPEDDDTDLETPEVEQPGVEPDDPRTMPPDEEDMPHV